MNNNDEPPVVIFSGGTGTPKLILGLRKFIPDRQLFIIGNIADDDHFYGLLVSPDIDTLLYLFANKLDLEKFWGVKEDSFITLKEVENMGINTWFKLGDKDLALHLVRNQMLCEGMTLSETIQKLSFKLNIEAKIFPPTNNPIRTVFYTTEKQKISFQDYTVKHREKDEISQVEYLGATNAKAVKEVIQAINRAKIIIIGPSNPITSINPILAVRDIRITLRETKAKIIAVSPIQEGKGFSGPVAQLMMQLNMEANSYGIAQLYQDFLDVMIISKQDEVLKTKITDLGIKVITTNISLKTENEKENLAKKILEIINY